MAKTKEYYIGRRLSYDGRLCTIRYIGEISGTKGEWLGVEWDDPARGKHSGEHQGNRYFTCVNPSPTSASFIRPARKYDDPQTFSEALRAKYSSDPEPSHYDFTDPDVEIVFQTQPGDNQKINNPTTRTLRPVKFGNKIAEEVGFDKIRKQLNQLEELRIVILDGMRMCRPEARKTEPAAAPVDRRLEDTSDVKDACPKAIESDLSRNLFEEWREVVSICEGLEKLASLRVDGTRFRDTTLTKDELDRALKAFAGITSFKLEEDLLSWEDLALLTYQFPDLATFSASSNLYTGLTSHSLNPTITDLTLEDNLISSLSSIASLTSLPKLRRLILKSNKISEVGGHIQFPNTVTEVDLSFNEIFTWAFIDELQNVFPSLTSLRVSHNPLFESLSTPDGRVLTADDGYMLTLARLGKLKTLNHSPINEKERLNAESYYLSMIAKEVRHAPEQMHESILKSHPRYSWLCEEYGQPDIQNIANTVNPNSLAARLLKIRFYLASDPAKSYEVEIPKGSTAYTTLGIVIKNLGVMPLKTRLVWETGDWMTVRRTVTNFDDDEYDSDDSEDEKTSNRVMREVIIVPGTRSIGTWIDGSEATVRVEVEP